jgi:hypothetical protein
MPYHGLAARIGRINDAQPTVPKNATTFMVRPNAFIIGSAMSNTINHPAHNALGKLHFR